MFFDRTQIHCSQNSLFVFIGKSGGHSQINTELLANSPTRIKFTIHCQRHVLSFKLSSLAEIKRINTRASRNRHQEQMERFGCRSFTSILDWLISLNDHISYLAINLLPSRKVYFNGLIYNGLTPLIIYQFILSDKKTGDTVSIFNTNVKC